MSRHVGGDGFYAVVGESWKYDCEAQSAEGSKSCIAMIFRVTVHYFVRAYMVTMGSSMDKGKEPQPLDSCRIWDV